MKKRYLSLIIVLGIILFTLVGCGNKTENENKQQENSVLENEVLSTDKVEEVIKAGDYTLEYGTKYTFKQR